MLTNETYRLLSPMYRSSRGVMLIRIKCNPYRVNCTVLFIFYCYIE